MYNLSMKKILLGIGTIVVATTPIIAAVSCGTKTKTTERALEKISSEELFQTLYSVKANLKQIDNGAAKKKANAYVAAVRETIRNWENSMICFARATIVNDRFYFDTFNSQALLQGLDNGNISAEFVISKSEETIKEYESFDINKVENKNEMIAFLNAIKDYALSWINLDKLGNEFDNYYASTGSDSNEFDALTIAAKEVSKISQTFNKFITTRWTV